MHKSQGASSGCGKSAQKGIPPLQGRPAQKRVFRGFFAQKNARSHVGFDQVGGLTITSKETGPAKTMRGLVSHASASVD